MGRRSDFYWHLYFWHSVTFTSGSLTHYIQQSFESKTLLCHFNIISMLSFPGAFNNITVSPSCLLSVNSYTQTDIILNLTIGPWLEAFLLAGVVAGCALGQMEAAARGWMGRGNPRIQEVIYSHGSQQHRSYSSQSNHTPGVLERGHWLI